MGIAALVCAALVGGIVPAAVASESDPGAAPVVGSFALGDDLEGTISERDGAFEFGLDVGPLTVGWDSRGRDDRHGLGTGWGFGFGHLETLGGVRVARASGGLFDSDPTHPTGLAGYGVQDARFDAAPGVLEPRGHGEAQVEYEYVLHELGGGVTYFNRYGDPVAQVGATGQRAVWVWDASGEHRLLGATDPDGVELVLDWETDPGAVIVRPGANLPPDRAPEPGSEPVMPEWRIELDGGRVSKVVDPMGGSVALAYHRSGLVDRVTGRSGASTVISWHASDDRVTRVESVRTLDADGAELSTRSWAPAGDGRVSSGWPVYGGDSELFWSNDPGFRYETVLSDGATRVVSEYNSLHELIERRMVATTASGDVTLREQSFEYPGTAGGSVPNPRALPGNWSRPVRSDVTVREAAGRERSVSESFVFDDLGRVIERTAVDGTRTVTTWDDVVPGGRPLPVGLQTEEAVIAPDGLTSRTVHTLNDERTAVVATEHAEGREGAPLTVTSRVEYDVEDDGFVSEERSFPVGSDAASDAAPVRTRWGRDLDPATGTLTVTETIGAGDPGAATTTKVVSLRSGGDLSVTGPSGLEAHAVLDLLGRPVEQRDPAGNVTRIRYETAQQGGRNATVVTAPDGVERTEERDPLGRITRLTDNIRDGVAVPGFVRVAERRAYPEPGVTSVTDAWGATTTAYQDVFGRQNRVVTENGLVQVTRHDEIDDTVTTGLTPTGDLADAEQTTTERFDLAGRVVAAVESRRDGTPAPAVEHTLDGFGRPVRTSDGITSTTTAFDEFGRPSRTSLAPADSDASGLASDAIDLGAGTPIQTEQRFDGFGTPTAKVIGDDRQSRSGTVRSFDALGRAVTETDQVGRVTRLTYTVDGLVARVEHGNGQLTVLAYDPDTRALTRSERHAPDLASVVTEYRYDEITGLLLERFDPADPAGTTITTDYDAFGNPTQVRYPDGAVISSEYDPHGRRTAVTDIEGNRTELTFDRAGLPTAASQQTRDGTPLASVTYAYDEFARISRLERGNGVVTEYTFTTAGQIETERTELRGAAQSEREYEYDVRGNLTQRIDTTDDSTGVTTPTTTAYVYDAYDRLTGSSVHDGDTSDAPVVSEHRYELSPSGDILRETTTDHADAGVGTTVRDFEYSPLGELTATTKTGPDGVAARTEQRYDEAGNLTLADDGTTYAYDAANRPIAQRGPDGAGRDTRYWADGSRRAVTERDESGVEVSTVTFHWEGAALLNDTVTAAPQTTAAGPDAAGGSRTASYLLGADRHARTVTSGAESSTSYFGTDRHRNVTDLTDHAGTITTQYAYTDYGLRSATQLDPSAPDTNPFGYASEYTDPDGGQHLAVRTYDPASMRFTTMDTADLHNTYAYAGLNPITAVDPTGRDAEADHGPILMLAGALIGLALTLASCAIAAPVGIIKALTVAFVLGDVITAANAAIQIAKPGGIPDEVTDGLEQAEIGFGVVAVIGIMYGFGRFVWAGFTRMHKEGMAAWRASRTVENTSDAELYQGFKTAGRRLVDSANQGHAQVTANFTPELLGKYVAKLEAFIWRTPVHHQVTARTNVAHKYFWVEFQRNMSEKLGRWAPWEWVEYIAKWAYSGANTQALQIGKLRDLAKVLGSTQTFHPFLRVPGGYAVQHIPPSHASQFAQVRGLASSARRADHALPLRFEPDAVEVVSRSRAAAAAAPVSRLSAWWQSFLK